MRKERNQPYGLGDRTGKNLEAATQRGEQLGHLDEKTGTLEQSAKAYYKARKKTKEQARIEAEEFERSSLGCMATFFGCCGSSVAEMVDAEANKSPKARPAPERKKTSIPLSLFTRTQIEAICEKMKSLMDQYNSSGNKTRYKQYCAFVDILNIRCSEMTAIPLKNLVPESIYRGLRNDIDSLREAVSADHAKNGGFLGVKVHEKSQLETILESCLTLLPPTDSITATATGAGLTGKPAVI